MTKADTLADLMELVKPLMEMGLVVRLAPPPGSRAENYAQTLSPTAHPVETRAAPAVRGFSESAAAAAVAAEAAHTAPAFDPTPMQKQIEDLDFQVRTLRRQLDALAWKLGHKLEG